MAYIAPYKLSVKRSSASDNQGKAVEGIQAFLSRVQKARQEADEKEDLAIQEKVVKGEISVDEQINYNKKRQDRFVPTSKEYQQLQNNIAELETARKWESFNLMGAQNVPLGQQMGFLKNWLSSVDPASALANNISEKIGSVGVQQARNEYRSEWEQRKADFDQGRAQRKSLIDYLRTKMSAVTDEGLKAELLENLNNQETALLQDADNLRNAAISSFDTKMEADNEGKLLGMLENDYQKDLSDGDAASAISRQGDIESQKRKFVSLSIQKQIDDAFSKRLETQDIDANQTYLSALQGIAQKSAMDFSYKGIDGEIKTMRIDDIGNYAQLDGKPLREALTNAINKFTTETYIPEYAQSLKESFSKLNNTAGMDYERLKNESATLLNQWTTFANQDSVKPFAFDLNRQFNGMQGTMVSGLLTALGNKFSSGDATDVETVRSFDQIQGMFPTMSGTEFEQYAIDVKQQIGRANFDKYQTETFGEIDKRESDIRAKREQIQLAMVQLDSLHTEDKGNAEYLDQKNQLGKTSLALSQDLDKLMQNRKDFIDKFSGDKKLYQQFVPNADTGLYSKPQFDISGVSELPAFFPDIQKRTEKSIAKVAKQEGVNLNAPIKTAAPATGKIKATAQYQIKIPNSTILKTKYKAGEYEFNPKDKTTYLKMGVEKRF